jgi:hypothetical protein
MHLLTKIPTHSQRGRVVRYADSDNFAVRLDDNPHESLRSGRHTVGYRPVDAECLIELG